MLEGGLCRGVVFVEDLSERGTVGAAVAEVLLGLDVVALGQIEVAQDLREPVGIGGRRDEELGGLDVAALQRQQTLVGFGFGQLGIDAQGLCQQTLGILVVATAIGDGGEVVVGTGIVGIDGGGQLIDRFLPGGRFFQRGAIEQFFDTQFLGVGLDLVEDLLVAATDGLVVDDEARTAQLRQDAVGQLTEGRGDVLDLLLALLRVFVHRQHAQDDVFVLDVAGFDQFLEAFPVLSRVFRIDRGVHLDFPEFLVDVLLRDFLTLVGQLVVDAETAVGRGIGRDFHVVEVQALTVVVDLLEHLDEFFHGVVFQLTLAEVGLLDEESDVGFLLFLRDTLIGIGRHGRLGRRDGAAVELGGGNDTVGHFYLRDGDLLGAQTGIEGHIEVGLVAVGIGEVGPQRIAAARAVGDDLIVVGHVLPLEGSGIALHALAVGIAQLGDDGDDRLLVHVFFRELTVDGSGNRTFPGLQRIGCHREVVSGERPQLRT